MTAPKIPLNVTWELAPDGDGEPTLWHAGWAVLRRSDMATPRRYQDALWQVLTRVLAPDEATIERLAALFFSWESPTDWSTVGPVMGNIFRQRAHEALAALAGTAAPQRDPEVGADD